MRILVIKLKQIGDVLLAEPALRFLKKIYPKAHLTVLVNDCAIPVLANASYIDRLLGYKRNLKKLSLFQRIKGEIEFSQLFAKEKYDMILSFSSGDRSAIYTLLSKGKYKVGWYSKKGLWGKNKFYDLLLKEPNTHAVLHDLFMVVKVTGIRPKEIKVNFYIPNEEIEKISKKLKTFGVTQHDKIILIHPVANWLFKCWRDDYMAEIINWLIEQGVKVILTAGKNKKELNRISQIMKNVRFKIINLAGQLNLIELAAVIWHSHLFFGVDTAPMHIAAALNKPVISLFGPTSPFHWGPWDNNQQVFFLKSPYKEKGFQTYGKHVVLQKDWACVPCEKDGCNKTKISRCLYEIKPKEVKKILEQKLN